MDYINDMRQKEIEEENMKKIGFIDYYLDEWHANNYPQWIREQSNGEFEVCCVYGEVPSPRPGGRTNEQWAKDMGLELCASIEEVIEKSDCLVVLAPDNPEQHLRLTELAAKSGKRLYIDKTFAPDKETALKIFENAAVHQTPCYSTSALRFASAYQDLDRENVRWIQSIGPGEFNMYCIHQIEPIVSIMGTEAKRVMFLGDRQYPSMLIEFSGGRSAQFTTMFSAPGFSMKVGYEDEKKAVAALQIEPSFWSRFIDNLLDFFRTGDVKVPHEQTVAIAAIREAAVEARKNAFTWSAVK